MSKSQLMCLHVSSIHPNLSPLHITKEVVYTITISLKGRWQGGKAAATWGLSKNSPTLFSGNVISNRPWTYISGKACVNAHTCVSFFFLFFLDGGVACVFISSLSPVQDTRRSVLTPSTPVLSQIVSKVPTELWLVHFHSSPSVAFWMIYQNFKM